MRSDNEPRSSALTMRAARALAATVLATAGLLIGHASKAHAATATINCDTASRTSNDWKECRKLSATSNCAWDNNDGTWTFALGYENPTSATLNGAVGGANNTLSAAGGSPSAAGQATTFAPGTAATAFTVTWSPSSKTDTLTWNLMGHAYQFTELSQPACTANPVPIFGNLAVVGGGLLLLLGLFFLLNHRRVAKLRRTPWLNEA